MVISVHRYLITLVAVHAILYTIIYSLSLLVLDMQQASIGSCSESDIAVSVLTTVISHKTDSGYLIIDCGWMGTSQQHDAEPVGYGHFIGEPDLKYMTSPLSFLV
jgi:D-serine deaminase-like pyridoxal phosphate-dependent protein